MKKIKFWKKKPEKKQTKITAKDALKTTLRVLPVLVIIIALSFAIKQISHFLVNSPHFFVDKAEVLIEGRSTTPELTTRYSVGVSSNIFSANIASIRNFIFRRHPEIKQMVVYRRLPNKIVVDIQIREPIMQIKAGKYYPVDREGVVLVDINDTPNPKLPVLVGAQGKIGKMEIGAKIDTPNFKQAKELIKAIIKTDFVHKHKFLYIDCYDYKNLSFFIDDGLEIKMGYDKYSEKLATLAKIFDDLNQDTTKYIDLRFKDVIVGPK